jgi:hypothetical protein
MAKPRLHHVSEEAGIKRFVPRPPPTPDAGVTGEVVWAVAESHLVNFLTPRDCPRICFRAGPQTTQADRRRFLGEAGMVVAVEAGWAERIAATTLYIDDMPAAPFEAALPEAGYWIARETVTPLSVRRQTGLLQALKDAGAEVRRLDDFWPLAEAVAASSLQFSILRWRNARPRGIS